MYFLACRMDNSCTYKNSLHGWSTLSGLISLRNLSALNYWRPNVIHNRVVFEKWSMPWPYWKVGKIATIAKIAANERKASRFGLVLFDASNSCYLKESLKVCLHYSFNFIFSCIVSSICKTRGCQLTPIEFDQFKVNCSRLK